MVFTINNVNILPYVASNGLKYTRSDLDGENAGRTMDGVLHRDRIASKIRWDITCKLLSAEELAVVLSLIEPEFVEVTFTNPATGTPVTKTMYSNNVPTTLAFAKGESSWWTSLTFPLIER